MEKDKGESTTLIDLIDAVVAGYKEWGSDKENFAKFLRHLRSESSLEHDLSLSQLITVTSTFDQLEDHQPFVIQIITLISVGYFLALREYRLLEKDLN